MNFKDWLIQEEDGKTVTLSHPKGHTMKIYTYALPKIQREQIKRLKMAKGGKVKPKTESNDHLSPASGGGVSEQGKDVREAKGAHSRQELTGVEADARADQHERFAKDEARGRMAMERTVKPKLKGLAHGGVAHYDEGTANQPVSQEDVNPIPQIPNQPAPNYAQPGLANQANSTLQGIQQGANSIQSQEAIDQAKAKMAEAPQEDVVQGLQSKQQADAQALQSVKGATDDFNAYVQNNPIDPKHYQESMGSGQKAATAIGLFLGGMSTSFGGHNYAFDYLNKQIDRDIDAQKQRTENQKTVYGAYQKLFEDSNVSTALAKASMYDIYGEKIKQNAIRLGTPEAIAKAQAAQADFAQKSAQLRMEAASMASGKAQSGKPVMPGAQKKTENPDHILNSNANDAANTLQYNPLYKDKMPAIMEQKTKADLADKAIDTIKATFPKLYQNTGGAGGYTRRFGHDLHGVPYVGGMADKAVQFLTDTNKNEAYDSDYQNVVGAVRGALQGNVSEDLLNQVVEANRPETNDPESLKAKKQQNMIDFVKSHTKTDLLEPTGLAKRR